MSKAEAAAFPGLHSLPGRRRLAFFALPFFLLLLARRPDALLHADFWAEDGWRWYPDAYYQGWHALFVPYGGYLQSICRLVALAAQPFPLAWAPTIFSLSALAIQVAAASFLLSARLDRVWPSKPARVAFATIYLLLPNSFEVYANLTNAQWHLSLLAFLLLVADPPRTAVGRIGDCLLLLLSGLSGPFCIFLLPVAILRFWRDRTGDRAWRLAPVLLCCIIQASCALGSGRGAAPLLGAGPRRLACIVALQIIGGTLLGRHRLPGILHHAMWLDGAIPVAITLAALALAIAALLRGNALLRQFCLYAALVFAAGLLRPATGSAIPAWLLFSQPDIGDRYYILPMLAWIGILFTLAAGTVPSMKWAGYSLLAMLALAIPGDLHFATPLATAPPTNFAEAARSFTQAAPGTPAAFPLHPQGARPMVLIKR